MKHPSITFLVALSLVLSAVAIDAAAASALENPEILPNPTPSAPLNLSGVSGAISLNTNGGAITSREAQFSGGFTSTRLGTIRLDLFESKFGATPCKTEGDQSGTILVQGADIHLVDILSSGTLTLGAAIVPSATLLLKCGTFAIEVKGAVIGEFKSVTSGVSIPAGSLEDLLFAATKPGDVTQQFKTCDLDKAFCGGKTICGGEVYSLSTQFGTGFEETAEEATYAMTFNRTASIDF